MVQTPGPPTRRPTLTAHGVYDCVTDAINVVELEGGSYNHSNPPGLGTGADPFPVSCGAPVTLTNGVAALESFNFYFASELNDDGLADLVESSKRTLTTFAVFYGNSMSHASHRTSVGTFAAAPQLSAPVTAMASDIVGEVVAFHPAPAGSRGVVNWENDLVASGLYATADTQRPLTLPYELRGDIRLTSDVSTPPTIANPPLHSEPRLGARVGTGLDQSRAGLDANQRGLTVDLPVMAGNGAAQVNSASVRVFRRVTDYSKLETGMPHRSYSWSEITRDSDGDLTTGSGPRFVTAVRGSGYVVRVLTDRAGVFVSFAP